MISGHFVLDLWSTTLAYNLKLAKVKINLDMKNPSLFKSRNIFECSILNFERSGHHPRFQTIPYTTHPNRKVFNWLIFRHGYEATSASYTCLFILKNQGKTLQLVWVVYSVVENLEWLPERSKLKIGNSINITGLIVQAVW